MQKNQVKNSPNEAVRNSLLTALEFESWVKYMRTDLAELYNQLKTTAKEELKKRLRRTKQEYKRRFALNSKYIQNKFSHTYDKVIFFIDEEIDKLQSELAERKSSLVDSETQSTNSKKLFWNGNLNELVWVFHQLKNKQTSKKDAKGNYLKYLSCNNEELIDFIFNNFELKEMTKSSLRKYIENPNLQKKIRFNDQ